MLTFELDASHECLTIHGSPEGLASLAEALQRLVASTPDGRANHDHLMTPEWGGTGLTADPQGSGPVIHHVQLYCWNTHGRR
jgi:hypothetical protein